MKETTPARTSHGGEFDSPPVSSAMPPCFDRWCKKFDDLLKTKAQKAVRPRSGSPTIANAHQEKRVQTLFRGIIRRKRTKKHISNVF